MAKNILNSISARVPDILGVLVIVTVWLTITNDVQSVRDIGLNDEAGYLRFGSDFGQRKLPQAVDSPLYVMWYFVLSWCQSDPVQLYYLNWRLLTLLPAIFLYLFLRTVKVHSLVGCIASCVLVVSRGNLETAPQVSHLALCTVFGGLAVAQRASIPMLFWGFLALTALITSYIRPEFFVVFVILGVTTFFLATRQKGQHLQFATLALYVALACALLSTLGFPFNTNNVRGAIAFQQHFSVNWVKWAGSTLDPWANSKQIVEANFGETCSIIDCLRINPPLVFKHVWSNACSVFPTATALLLYSGRHYTGLVSPRLYSCFLAALIVFALSRVRLASLERTWRNNLPTGLAILIFLLPPCLTTVLIYPRDHYLILSQILFLAFVLLLIRDSSIRSVQGPLPFLCVASLFISIHARPERVSMNRLPIRNTIDFLSSSKFRKKMQLLNQGGICHYLPNNWTCVELSRKSESYMAFAKKYGINAVLVSKQLEQDPQLRSDPGWVDLVAAPGRLGFTKIAVPNTTRYLLVSDDLFER
jgi:hypothetical protein